MKLAEVFRYEIEHRLRSLSTWIYAAFFLFAGFAMIMIGADANSPVHVNAPMRLALFASFAGMLGMLVAAALFGDAAIRDHETGMASLLFTLPMHKLDYLAGRFLGALAIGAVVFLAFPVGQLIATLLPYVPRDALGPVSLLAFAQSYLLFLLPNLLISGAILFVVAMLTRQAVAVYVAAIVMFVGYLVALNITGSGTLAGQLSDPFGVHVLTVATERWTPVERNARFIGSSDTLLVNRAVWMLIAIGFLVALHRWFRFAHVGVADRAPRTREVDGPGSSALTATALPTLATTGATSSHGFAMGARQALAIAWRGIADVVTSPVFLLLFAGKIGLTILFGWDAGESVFDTSTTPVTILIIERLSDTPLLPITYLLLTVFAGELIWSDREHNAAELVDAAPVSDSAQIVGRFTALIAILAVLQIPVLLGGVVTQTLQHYTSYQLGVYVRVLFGLQLTELMLLSALAVLVHVIVNQKYLAHLVVVVLLIARVAVRGLGWFQHHLLLYGTDPGWKYSGMNGFGPFVRGLVWFRSYWSAWAALLLIVAALLWVRGRETGLRHRIVAARGRFAGGIVRVAGLAVGLIAVLGGFVFYNTNILHDYRGGDDRFAPQAAYETRYRRYADIPQPTIVSAALRVDIHPETESAELRGRYRVVNQTTASIDSVHVVVTGDLQVRSLSVDGGAREVMTDGTAGYHVLALARPLSPGDSANLDFDLVARRHGFSNDAPSTALASNGTWLDRRFLPFIGYQPIFELSDQAVRRRLGLAPRAAAPAANEPGAAETREVVRGEAPRVSLDAVVGTSGDQMPLTPGTPVRSWTEGRRRYVEYRSDARTSLEGGFFSARYAVRSDRWTDVSLRALYDPSDPVNVDRMLRGAKAALAYCTTNFEPYGDSLLQVLEVPRYSVFGIALPVSMAFSEDAFHSHVGEDEIDQPFYGAAHETAHQWWGGMTRGAPVKGHGLLSESLANYSAMMAMEKTFGPDVAWRVYHVQMDRYFRGHGEVSWEVPLVDVEDQAYLTYRKGAVVLYTLRDQLGEAAVSTALRKYAEKFHHDGPPYPTSRDLLAELRAVTPDSLQSLITDLFETVTLWEVKTTRATAERMAGGAYQVTLDVSARKLRADGLGHETEIPMNDLVEIGVFGKESGDRGKPLYLARRRVHSGAQTIRVIVAAEPVRAGIDPNDKLIDRERGDNMRDVASSPVNR